MAFALKWREVGYPWKTVIRGQFLVPPQLKPVEVMISDAKMPALMRAGQWGGAPSSPQKWAPTKVYVVNPADGTGADQGGTPTVLVAFPAGNYARTAKWDEWRAKMAAGNEIVATVGAGSGVGLNIYGEKMVATQTGLKPVGAPPAAAYPIAAPTSDPLAPPPPGSGPGASPGAGGIGQIVGGTTGGIPTWMIVAAIVGGVWWWRSRR